MKKIFKISVFSFFIIAMITAITISCSKVAEQPAEAILAKQNESVSTNQLESRISNNIENIFPCNEYFCPENEPNKECTYDCEGTFEILGFYDKFDTPVKPQDVKANLDVSITYCPNEQWEKGCTFPFGSSTGVNTVINKFKIMHSSVLNLVCTSYSAKECGEYYYLVEVFGTKKTRVKVFNNNEIEGKDPCPKHVSVPLECPGIPWLRDCNDSKN